jgi:hypothetical protein
MHVLTFEEAEIAFNQGPTSENAWHYLIAAIESASAGLIDRSAFLDAVSEVASFVSESSRGKALVELLVLTSASIRLATAAKVSPPKSSATRPKTRSTRLTVPTDLYGRREKRLHRARASDV